MLHFLGCILGCRWRISSQFYTLNKDLLIIKLKVVMYWLKQARNPVRYAPLRRGILGSNLRVSGELAEWSTESSGTIQNGERRELARRAKYRMYLLTRRVPPVEAVKMEGILFTLKVEDYLESWLSGRKRRSWKPLNRKVPRVRIPHSPPFSLEWDVSPIPKKIGMYVGRKPEYSLMRPNANVSNKEVTKTSFFVSTSL